MRIILLSALILLTTPHEIVLAINCGNREKTILQTEFFNYTSDNAYQGLASIPLKKKRLPQTIANPQDQELIKTHRIMASTHTSFSYKPIIRHQGYHIMIFTMIENEFKTKGERVFRILVGDEVVHTIDMVAEAGYGKIIHKWIELDIREDVAYLNGTMPALNGFKYDTHQLKITFQAITGRPKVEALMLLRGTDAHQYLRKFLQHQQEKNIIVKQYLAEKYRKHPDIDYPPLRREDITGKPKSQSSVKKFVERVLNLQSIAYLLCTILAIHGETIARHCTNFLKGKLQKMKGKLEEMNSELKCKKKKRQ